MGLWHWRPRLWKVDQKSWVGRFKFKGQAEKGKKEQREKELRIT